ncbi:MAG: hypothetical protein WC503_06740 [Candidatus Shapirobacteria bacterium]
MSKNNIQKQAKAKNLIIISILIIGGSWFLIWWTGDDAELMAGFSLILFGPAVIVGLVLLIKGILDYLKAR